MNENRQDVIYFDSAETEFHPAVLKHIRTRKNLRKKKDTKQRGIQKEKK